ncbi:hypothetical protein KTQ42_03060|uniref:hypothetical protein n=1 Tax=Noviherbaspirillum sp. L7-7A TaxID=2850560 RepID=UPI001C2BAAAB|nr:hypothetical protein [Noviherbaspirillum sp. L7-7A]MBV0878284.1 hypothetical protein [Noviherbaspirillum sp. L7-7A]
MKDQQRQDVQVRNAAVGSSKEQSLSDDLLDTITGGGSAITGNGQHIEPASVSGPTDVEILNKKNSKKRIDYA